MTHEILYSERARDDLRRLELKVAQRIIKKLGFYADVTDPLVYAKRLTNNLFGEYRFRIGAYRVLFDCDRKGRLRILKILRIGHRKEIYL